MDSRIASDNQYGSMEKEQEAGQGSMAGSHSLINHMNNNGMHAKAHRKPRTSVHRSQRSFSHRYVCRVKMGNNIGE